METDNSPRSLHPKRKLFLLITLMLLSLIFSRSIDLGYLPESGMKAISVQIEYKGVFQEQIERLITSPLENELQSIPGIKRISSVCEQESATITIFSMIPLNLTVPTFWSGMSQKGFMQACPRGYNVRCF